jgi:hypothetical protein
MAGSNLQMSHPMSVKEISQKATDFQFNPFIPLKYWLRTADSLLREVTLCHLLHRLPLTNLKTGLYLRARAQ